MEPTKPIEIPSRRFGRYLLRSRLGVGGMAEVFLADVVDERGQQGSVALKLMKKNASRDAFDSEADLMGLLQHPNLVRRLEVGEAFGRPFIAMEFLMGGDLASVREALRRESQAFPLRCALHVGLETLKGLAYFHQVKTRSGTPLGLVHGDVNPANVFFSNLGAVKLGDFGVAKSQSLNLGPADGVAAGKLLYLSPEQTRGQPLTPASDLFAVGVMLYELLTGRHPFCRADGTDEPKAAMEAIRAARLTVPDAVPKPLATVLRRALHPDVAGRYRSAGEFAGALYHFALDADALPTPEEVETWLEGVLGIVA